MALSSHEPGDAAAHQLETALGCTELPGALTQPSVLTGAQADAAPRGCLVGNTTAQLAGDDDAARTLVLAAFEGLVDVVGAALRRAQAAGEVRPTSTPETQAQLVLLLFQGSALMTRAGVERERLAASIDVALDALAAA